VMNLFFLEKGGGEINLFFLLFSFCQQQSHSKRVSLFFTITESCDLRSTWRAFQACPGPVVECALTSEDLVWEKIFLCQILATAAKTILPSVWSKYFLVTLSKFLVSSETCTINVDVRAFLKIWNFMSKAQARTKIFF
jgi:hypothetical protein